MMPTGLGDQDPIQAAYTRTCLADESCARELFLDMTLGNRFDTEGFYAGFVLKWSSPIILHTEFADVGSGQIAEEMVEAVIETANVAGLSLVRGPADPGVGDEF